MKNYISVGTAGSKNAIIKSEQSIKLFDSSQSNNFLSQTCNNLVRKIAYDKLEL